FHQLYAVDRIHPEVQQGGVEGHLLDRAERVRRIPGGGHVEAHRLEAQIENLDDRGVVVDDEDAAFHAAVGSVMRVKVTKGGRRGRDISVARTHEARQDVSCRFSTSTIGRPGSRTRRSYTTRSVEVRGFR